MLLKLDGNGTLQQQLYRSLRSSILSRSLPAGSRVPSTRSLASELALSRNTVSLAYDQLLAEGYLTARRGSGTFVPAELPDDMTLVSPSTRPQARSAPGSRIHVSQYAQRLRATMEQAPVVWPPRRRTLPYDFRYGRPALADFPHDTWCRILGRRARRASARSLDYGPPQGAVELREEIAKYVGRARGVTGDPDRILIVNGSQQALDLAARVLLDPGDRVLLEEPHYAGARGVFSAFGARLVAAPVDDDGLRVSGLAARGRGIRLAYVTPTHQFPTGVTMPLRRRLELLAWAEHNDVTLFEDDYDSEYRYRGRPVEALQALDRGGRVIYAGTFSKLMFPALRLGYLVLPPDLVEIFRAAKGMSDTGSATLFQLSLADFIREGHFERHLRRSRARNAERRAALLDALDASFGDRVQVAGTDAGLHVLIWLDDLRPSAIPRLRARAAESGVGVYPVHPFYLGPVERAGLLLGYAALSEEEIATGVRRLAAAVDEMLRSV